MEATAAFVFSSGGVVRVDELSLFFQRRPEVFAAVLTAAAPTHALKKIVGKFGAQHGLFWCDEDPQSTSERGPAVEHVLTTEQRQRGGFDSEVQWVPRALAAVDRHVRALPGQLMKTGAISDFYSAYPEESEFMKRRCHSIVDFIQHYDPQQQRIGWDSTGFFCVQRAGGGERGGQEGLEEDSVASFAQLERVVHAEFVSSYVHARQEIRLGEPFPEPQDDDRLETQAVHSSWPRCTRGVSILPTSATSDQNELQFATVSVHESANSDINKDSDGGESYGMSYRTVAGALSLTCPALGCKFRPEMMWMIEFLDRASLLLIQVRSVPKPHPFVLLIMKLERRVRASKMRKMIRHVAIQSANECIASALALWSQRKLKSQEASPLILVTPRLISAKERTSEPSHVISPSVSVVSFTTGEWTFEMTLSTLVQVNKILLQAQTTPAPHPLALLFVAFEHRKQSQRIKRKTRKSQVIAKSIGGLNILIPKATLELLSCCLAAALPKSVV